MSPRKERRKARTSPRKATVPRRVRALERLLAEAGAREAATAEILRAISRSPGDTQAVFETIAERAQRLCGAKVGIVARYDGDLIQLVALRGVAPEAVAAARNGFPMRPDDETVTARTVRAAAVVHVPDVFADPLYQNKAVARAMRYRASLGAPMIRDGHVIGAIFVARTRPGPFADSQIELLKTFADQAVITIENVRLFTETKEALERQTATAEILKVISESPTDVQPVFEAIVRAGVRLFEGAGLALARPIGNEVRLAATAEAHAGGATRMWQRFPIPLDRAYMHSAAILDGRMIDVPDATVMDGHFDAGKQNFLASGNRAITIVPMMNKGAAIGTISVVREKPGALSDKQIALLQTFADQAVIAIENVRLFNELQASNRDLADTLDRQTATAEILGAMSDSMTDTTPVFDAIAKSCGALFKESGISLRLVRDGVLEPVANIGFPAGAMPVDRGSVLGACVLEGRSIHLPDLDAAVNEFPRIRQLGLKYGYHSGLYAPMMRDGVAIGAIAVLRPQKGAFGDKEVEVLKTFADQAVIAIGNVRLFKELEARNREITEALEQQTATSEILRVIASTTTDLQPVFQTIADSAVRLCDGAVGGTMLFDGELIHLAAHRGFTPEGEAAYRGTFPLRPTRANLSGRAIVDRTVVHVPDVEADPSLPISQALHDAQRWRAALSVPMLRDGQPIGAISVARLTPGPFSDKQIALLQAFADQAVIAIENARLLKELEARTAELTRSVDQLIALGEVGRAVTSSLDLDTVLATIVSRAVQLTGLEAGAIYEYDERTETFDLRATERLSEDEVHVLRTVPLRRGEGAVGQTAVTLEPVQVPDITDTRLYESRLRDLLIRSGHRALLAVPLLRESQLIGALVVNRKTPGEFSPEVVELLRTFAAQSVLAIQNARLFREIEDKSRQLEQASRHKSQFLASMSHELRTPLNAILGLNEMLLGEVYGEVPEDMKPPLVQTQASGRHLLGLINNVLDLAKIEANRLDLALAPYVVQDLLASVRATLAPLAAEKGLAFTASAPDDLPVARGDAGRLTQCLINLAGNALKFTKEGRVALRVELVEDRLRFSVADTGIGIAPDKMADLFTEFKQTDATIAREYGGTGLGLAITRKFIELHKGSIWVESELGRGSTFIFEIPLQVPA